MVYRKASQINSITFVNLRFEIQAYEKYWDNSASSYWFEPSLL